MKRDMASQIAPNFNVQEIYNDLMTTHRVNELFGWLRSNWFNEQRGPAPNERFDASDKSKLQYNSLLLSDASKRSFGARCSLSQLLLSHPKNSLIDTRCLLLILLALRHLSICVATIYSFSDFQSFPTIFSDFRSFDSVGICVYSRYLASGL